MALKSYTRMGPDGRRMRSVMEAEREMWQMANDWKRGSNAPDRLMLPWDIDAPEHVRKRYEQGLKNDQVKERQRNKIIDEAEKAERAARADQINRKTQGMSPEAQAEFRQQLQLQERYEKAQREKEWYLNMVAKEEAMRPKRRSGVTPDYHARMKKDPLASIRGRGLGVALEDKYL